MYAFILSGLIIIAFTINAGYCLKCYKCNDLTNKDCADPFTKKDAFQVECSRQTMFSIFDVLRERPKGMVASYEYLCVKLNVTSPEKNWLIRSCVAKPETGNFCKQLVEGSKAEVGGSLVVYCRTCRRDGCNGGGKVKAVFVAIILGCVVSVLPQYH